MSATQHIPFDWVWCCGEPRDSQSPSPGSPQLAATKSASSDDVAGRVAVELADLLGVDRDGGEHVAVDVELELSGRFVPCPYRAGPEISLERSSRSLTRLEPLTR